MTADQLQRLSRRLSDSCWCRHWLHWNYPCQAPWLMAVSCMDVNGVTVEVPDLERRGLAPVRYEGLLVYTIARLDEQGNPYKSTL